MKPHRRQFLHLTAGATALPAVSSLAMAQTYPSRPVRIIVGFPAGGSADIFARLIGERLTERLGQQFVIRRGSDGESEQPISRRSDPRRRLWVDSVEKVARKSRVRNNKQGTVVVS